MEVPCATGKIKASILFNHRSRFYEIILNGCSLLRICSMMGRCKTTHAEKLEWKMDGPQPN